MNISILIAEDDALLRNLLNTLLAQEDGLEVVGTVATGPECLEAVRKSRPQVLLLDLHLPGMSGLKVLEALEPGPDAPLVLVLSGSEDEETQLQAARGGARGFLPKSQAASVLANAIRSVAQGEVWFSRRVSERIFQEFHQLARRTREQDKPLNQLSEREREVLICVARGMTNSQIAGDLYMSVHTVKVHIQSILRKLNLPNRVEAAVYAVREGLVASQEDSSPR